MTDQVFDQSQRPPITAKNAFERMRLSAQYLQREHVLLFPFQVLDATLREHLQQIVGSGRTTYPFKRIRLTEGSIQYSISLKQGESTRDLADFYLRMIARDQTFISITLRLSIPGMSTELHEYWEGWCKLQLMYFISVLYADQKRMKDLAAMAPTPDNIAVISAEFAIFAPGIIQNIPRDPGGRPRQSDDDWAWEQVHIHHRPSKEVKKEWRQRNKENARIPTNEQEAWRNALRKTRGDAIRKRRDEKLDGANR